MITPKIFLFFALFLGIVCVIDLKVEHICPSQVKPATMKEGLKAHPSKARHPVIHVKPSHYI